MIKILSFLKKYLFQLLLLVGVVVFLVLKVFKSKPKDKTGNANDILLNEGITTAELMQELTKASELLAHHLGTAYPTYDPRHWTENDKEVYDILKVMTQSHFQIVSLLYHDVYAKGRTLSSDLAKLLDDEYYKLLPF